MVRWFLGVGALAVATPLFGQPAESVDRSAAPEAIDPARWITDKDQPRGTRIQAERGVVRFVLAIDARGEIYRCDIMRSSNSAMLDEKACALMRLRGKFEPARDRAGVPVPSEVSRTVVWGPLDDFRGRHDAIIEVQDLPSGKNTASLSVREVIAADGTPESCVVEKKSEDASLDQQACKLVAKALASLPPLKAADETPVRGMRVRRIGFVAKSK